jgi:hypothetical protein
MAKSCFTNDLFCDVTNGILRLISSNTIVSLCSFEFWKFSFFKNIKNRLGQYFSIQFHDQPKF